MEDKAIIFIGKNRGKKKRITELFFQVVVDY